MTPTRSFFTGLPPIQHKGHERHHAETVDWSASREIVICCVHPTGFSFEVTQTDGGARRGRMTTAHGVVETPAFMPVGTQGAVKGLTHRDLESVGAEILL